MSEWKQGVLSDVAEIVMGQSPAGETCNLIGNGLPLLNGPTEFGIRFPNPVQFTTDPKRISEINDILFCVRGSTTGRMNWANQKYALGRGLAAIRHKRGEKYRYFVRGIIDFNLSLLLSSATGSTFPNISRDQLNELEILLPPLPEQKAIASVLSSLDDKIDLLHRQNKTLEAIAAETLFRQWFIEEAQEDWEEVCLEDITQRITDGSHYSPPTTEEGMPMASVKDMYDWGINKDTCRRISYEDYKKLVDADCRPLKNDILIAKDGSYLKHVFVVEQDLDIVILSSIAILRPNFKMHPILLALFLKQPSTLDQLENIVTGAVIPRIVLKDFRKFQLLLPPKNIQERAVSSIFPLYRKCWGNNKQIRTLERLRDTLLPKLMSGEVRVAS
jgi:type I restriction enzyme S subunit